VVIEFCRGNHGGCSAPLFLAADASQWCWSRAKAPQGASTRQQEREEAGAALEGRGRMGCRRCKVLAAAVLQRRRRMQEGGDDVEQG
jgi:hypothetical protein